MKNVKPENPEFKYKPYILSSCDYNTRFKGSAGGVVSEIIRYMFEKGYINSALTFYFDRKNFYLPEIAYSFDEYNITGSIYHEIDIVSFIKKNINSFTDRFLVTALPCQVKAIKEIAKRNKKEVFVISLTCSAQQNIEATYFLLDYLGIKKEKVKVLKYRGNGWPSGIYIRTDDGKEFKVGNIDSIWMYMFHSYIFSLDRCLTCSDTFGIKSDVIVADPWLERYLKKEKTGATITVPNSEKGFLVIKNAIKDKYLCIIEEIPTEEVILSQQDTIKRKFVQRKHRKLFKKMAGLFRTKIYKNFIFKNFPELHLRVINAILHKIFFKKYFQNGIIK